MLDFHLLVCVVLHARSEVNELVMVHCLIILSHFLANDKAFLCTEVCTTAVSKFVRKIICLVSCGVAATFQTSLGLRCPVHFCCAVCMPAALFDSHVMAFVKVIGDSCFSSAITNSPATTDPVHVCTNPRSKQVPQSLQSLHLDSPFALQHLPFFANLVRIRMPHMPRAWPVGKLYCWPQIELDNGRETFHAIDAKLMRVECEQLAPFCFWLFFSHPLPSFVALLVGRPNNILQPVLQNQAE